MANRFKQLRFILITVFIFKLVGATLVANISRS